MDFAQEFRNKKITLMGLGLLGRGLGDAKFLAAAGADLIITDLKTETELASSIAELREFPNIIFHLGGHNIEDFENRDLILRAPNAPLDSPFLAYAREQHIPIEMDASFFVKLSRKISPTPPTIVGITGTRGKSTVTQLVYEMACEAFGEKKVFLGGNVRDTATLPLIEKIASGDVVILELDSWQLQGFEEGKVSPNIAVWTNFLPDHMNYYHGDMDRYFQDKAAIARFQNADDIFIAPLFIKEKFESRFGPLAGKYIEPKDGFYWEIALPGEHNRANSACAITAAQALGISDEVIKKILKTFTGLPNRLQFLGEKHGIAFYNDSNATTPDATLAALRAIAEQKRPIILIAGGSDKELDFAELAHAIEKYEHEKNIKKIILFKGKASEKLKELLPSSSNISPVMAANMHEAFAAAMESATANDIILLSPAATSFGIFKNEYDRGDQFMQAFQAVG